MPLPKRNMDNAELITYFMERSRTGVISQLFVLMAIGDYAKRVVEAPEGFMENNMISEYAWRAAAKEILGLMDNRPQVADKDRDNEEED